MRKIFGRDPALIAGLIEGIVLLATTFGLNWSAEQIGTVNAVLSVGLALYVAWGTVDTATAVLLQLAKALLALVVAFGVDVTADQTGAIIALLTMAIAAYTRTQVKAIVPAKYALAA